jgi:phosphate:Na+ symporter
MRENIMVLIQLLGGVGLFLYGMKLMVDGLENATGDKLKVILERVTTNPISALLAGTIITAIVQNSTVTTVMVVGLVNSGLISLIQATGIIMGANIGTTITAQLVALKLAPIAPIFIAMGTFIVLFVKGKKKRELGHIVLGFGILFMSVGIMSSLAKQISNSPAFESLIVTVGDSKLMGLFVGLIITGAMQSSAATTGILIVLASTGSISMNIAIPILFGCNIGTCIPTLLATVGTNKIAKKAGIVHLLFNVLGTIIFMPFMSYLSNFVQYINPQNIERQIANAYSLLNIANALVMLPLIKYFVIISNKIIVGTEEIENQGAQYIDERLLETPVIAAGQVIKETIRMATKAKENLELSIVAFHTNDEKLVKRVYENEKLINTLSEAITSYLVKLSKYQLSDKEDNIVAATFHTIIDIERIGDHVENIADLTLQKVQNRITYTDEALEELNYIYNYTINALQIAIEAYEKSDVNKANEVYLIEEKIDVSQRSFRENHIRRLNNGICNPYDGAIFIDLLSNFERIGDHSTNIADMVIQNYQ